MKNIQFDTGLAGGLGEYQSLSQKFNIHPNQIAQAQAQAQVKGISLLDMLKIKYGQSEAKVKGELIVAKSKANKTNSNIDKLKVLETEVKLSKIKETSKALETRNPSTSRPKGGKYVPTDNGYTAPVRTLVPTPTQRVVTTAVSTTTQTKATVNTGFVLKDNLPMIIGGVALIGGIIYLKKNGKI
ncbi:hypothetical protein [Tenacibaculum piscium]|uniref:hypothetical protein n=1 Tax=Tenacibaculum piscium TaxID=1458515 RepID=UPI00187B336B|nr:hypothetical protein [Tenacibaculum piscium]MBE7690688.1 hypothetical protein [Tenacibaculum piscium]